MSSGLRTASLAIRTERLVLRPLCADDREEFIRVHDISRDHFGPWMPASDPRITSYDRLFDSELARAEAERSDGTGLRLVGHLEDGRMAGLFSLSQIFRRSFQNAYAGWRVAVDQIGRGLATEAVIALLDVSFSRRHPGLGLHRVQANIIPRNAASIRVAEKAGFRLEGTAERYLEINGSWQDHHMFAKTSEEHTCRYLG